MMNKCGIVLLDKNFYLFSFNNRVVKLHTIKGENSYDISSYDDLDFAIDYILKTFNISDFRSTLFYIIYDNMNFNYKIISRLIELLKNSLSINVRSLTEIFHSYYKKSLFFKVIDICYKYDSYSRFYEIIKYNSDNCIVLSPEILFSDIIHIDYLQLYQKLCIIMRLNYPASDFSILRRIILIKALIKGMPIHYKTDKESIRRYIKDNLTDTLESKLLDYALTVFKVEENKLDINLSFEVKKSIISSFQKFFIINEIRDIKYLNYIISIFDTTEVKEKISSYFN